MNEVSRSLYRGHRFPAEVISQAVWLYFRFPLSLPMVEDQLAARGIIVSHETVWRWAEKFGRDFARTIRTVRNFVCGLAVDHHAAMALMKRSPKSTAN